MVVGLSIAHGSPGSNTPSIVSATFSCDAAVYRYIHKAKLQEKGVGLITCLKELMIEGCKVSFSPLKKFLNIVKNLGQLNSKSTFLNPNELNLLLRGSMAKPKSNQPKLSFIVSAVQRASSVKLPVMKLNNARRPLPLFPASSEFFIFFIKKTSFGIQPWPDFHLRQQNAPNPSLCRE